MAIENVTQFVSEVTEWYKNTNSKKHLFFRGHSDKAYTLKPTVLRSSKFDEKEILLDFKQYSPAHNINYDFICERDKVLADMQHYKIPTRLLDWTLSPLNALYFSCCQHDDKDGEVIILDAWHYWGEVVKNNKSIEEIHQIHILSRALLAGKWKFDKIREFIGNEYLWKDLTPEDILLPFPYIANYTNNRILHQRGCFTIHGTNHAEMESMPEIKNFIKRMTVKGEKKKSILNELNILYINEYSIYPDFEGMQKMIKDTGSLFSVKYLQS